MTKKRILIADDDESICETLTVILEDEGYEAEFTTDGDVVDRIVKNRPNLILLDIWMSGVDGRDICKYLKSKKDTASIPVILISANNDIAKIAKEVNADGFITKPFDIDYLLNEVSSLVN